MRDPLISLLIMFKAPPAYTLDSTPLRTFATGSQRRLRDEVPLRTPRRHARPRTSRSTGGRDSDRPPTDDRTRNDLSYDPDDRGCPMPILLGQGSLMIHLEGTLLAQHHRPGTCTPLRSRLTKEEVDCCGGGCVLQG